MFEPWWIPAGAVAILALFVLIWRPIRAASREARFAQARRDFHTQRERLEVNPGRYDVQIRTDGEVYLWEDMELTGTVEVEAARKPPRKLR